MKLVTKLVLAVLAGLFVSIPKLMPSEAMTGKIINISPIVADPIPMQNVTVKLPSGDVTAQTYDTQVSFKSGDKVILNHDPSTNQYTVADFARVPELAQLFVIFLFVVVLVTGLEGMRSLFGLVASFMIIFNFALPQIMAGSNPLLVALITSSLIMLFSYYLTHGVSIKTTIAVFGTFFSLVLTGVLATLYASLAKLSGFGSEEASFLLSQIPGANMRNLLLAGIIIGTLGVLDDVTISQTSVVAELKEANKKLTSWELFVSAMRVGRDHIASVVNTLVLVYAGASLPLLLLFTNSQASTASLLNYEAVAEEVVRTLVGSVGLVLAVPITTAVAAYYYGRKK